MNRTEQKERIGGIIQLAKDTIASLERKKSELELVFKAIDALNESAYALLDGGDVIDYDELRTTVVNQFFEEELESLYDMSLDFQEELLTHISELSEKRAEQLEDKYIELNQVVESFNQSMHEYEDIDNLIEHIEESIDLLQEMKK